MIRQHQPAHHHGVRVTMAAQRPLDDPSRFSETIAVLIVEDHQLLAEALGAGLGDATDIQVAAIAGSCALARETLRTRRFDVALVDLQLPDGDGLQLAAYIREQYPHTQVVICTARMERELVTKALDIGCIGWLSKNESFLNVAGVIRAAAAGAVSFSPGIASLLSRPPDAAPAPGADVLTAREREIVRLIAQGKSTREIAQELFVSANTMRNYYARINDKLGAHSKVEVVMRALELGVIGPETHLSGRRAQS